jgi:hypothetical protein
MTTLPGAQMLNACFPKGQMDRAFERLLNRIERSLVAWDSHGILLCDQGKEGDYTRLVRRMNIYNPIASRFGSWGPTGSLGVIFHWKELLKIQCSSDQTNHTLSSSLISPHSVCSAASVPRRVFNGCACKTLSKFCGRFSLPLQHDMILKEFCGLKKGAAISAAPACAGSTSATIDGFEPAFLR